MTNQVIVNDKMQSGYTYFRTAEVGDLPANFNPNVTPEEMLTLGVFGGKYMTDCTAEFPDWFANAKLSPNAYRKSCNLFGIEASQSLSHWREKGWIDDNYDPRGWFQWYCRYYSGRRLGNYDDWQIGRWRKISRHLGQIIANCEIGDINCRPRQRQTLLHWGLLVDGSMTAIELRELFKK
jgi:hypothetical protein